MNRLFLIFAFLLISFAIYGFYISQFEFNLIQPRLQNDYSNRLFYDYKVALNVYSHLSTGSGNILTITEEAKRAKLDFVLLSDLNSNYNLEPDQYLNGVGLLTGNKIDNRQDDSTEPFQIGRNLIYFSAVQKSNYLKKSADFFNDSKALIIEAHPIRKPYQLVDLQKNMFDGIEVLNFKSITQHAWKESRISTLWSMLYYPFNPRLALMRLFNEPTKEIAIFDQLSQLKKVNFFVGEEATARAIPFADWLIKFPSYETTFNIASQHVILTSELTGEIKQDAEKILGALKNGRSYVAFDALGSSTGFEIYLENNKKKYFTGDSVPFKKDLKIFYKLPSEPIPFYEVVLFKNGQRVDHLNTFQGQFNLTTPGVYRLQVRLSPRLPLPDAIKWINWIYTNNFYVSVNPQ